MTPVPDPQGWGRTDGLLVKQQVRAEARRLFIGSGSLTWFLRPRLASPESTTEVEDSHPLVKVQRPTILPVPASHPVGRAGGLDLGALRPAVAGQPPAGEAFGPLRGHGTDGPARYRSPDAAALVPA